MTERQRLRIFTCTDHEGYWPVGPASVVVAENETAARKLLDAALADKGLGSYEEHEYTLQEVEMVPQAIVLCDGDY